MYDYSVNSNLGAVIFNPFLTTLNPNAPTIPIFNVSASAGANGAINPTGDVTANYGSSQNFTITPNVGYHVADVVVDNISQGVLSSYTFLNVVGPRSISATFAINTYTITVTQSANGNISPGTSIVNYGDDKSFTITANTGYYIVSVSVNGSSVGAVSSYIAQNIQGATSISATFAPIPAPTASPTPIPTQTQSSTNPPVPTQTQSPTPTLNPNPHKPTIFSVQITALQKSNTDKMGNWQCSRMWLWLDFLTARLHRQQIFRL
jgi:cell division septation protein DedD